MAIALAGILDSGTGMPVDPGRVAWVTVGDEMAAGLQAVSTSTNISKKG